MAAPAATGGGGGGTGVNFDINTWVTNRIPNGGVLSSLFQVKLKTPTGSTNASAETISPFQVSGASLPGDAIEAIEATYMGRSISLPGNRAVSTWAVTIMCDTDWEIRSAMEEWMEKISGKKSNVRSGGAGSSFFSNLTADMEIYVLDRTGANIDSSKKKGVYTIYDAWPSELGAIEMAWGTNEIATFSCTFSYSYWLPGQAG